jgi:hypothetical protein
LRASAAARSSATSAVTDGTVKLPKLSDKGGRKRGRRSSHGSLTQTKSPPGNSGRFTAAGGLWLVEAESLDAAQALYRADLFWPTGLRKSVQVLHWRRVFADGRRRP